MKNPDICPRCGGDWGDDPTCFVCVDSMDQPRDLTNYTRHQLIVDVLIDEDNPFPITESDAMNLALDAFANDNDLIISAELVEVPDTSPAAKTYIEENK